MSSNVRGPQQASAFGHTEEVTPPPRSHTLPAAELPIVAEVRDRTEKLHSQGNAVSRVGNKDYQHSLADESRTQPPGGDYDNNALVSWMRSGELHV